MFNKHLETAILAALDAGRRIMTIYDSVIEVEYKEEVVHSESRTITINFEPNDSKIEIIGTYVIPEFGVITMMILIVGITSMIILTKNKFQTGI